MKRIIFRIQHKSRFWEIKSAGYANAFERQIDAVRHAVLYCRNLLDNGQTSQLVLHGKDGRIRWERTYGKDPRRSRG
jgi:hypothetical protein